MVRGLDHLVVAVRDLNAAAERYQALGFTVTPENRHPWGTANRLIQLDGFFIELLTVADESLIVEPEGNAFSFGAFNRDFLRSGEGASMIVLEGRDPAADRSAFLSAGLKVFDPFSFGRIANLPDGSQVEVGFDLTFAGDPLSPSIGYITCRNRFPQNFWKPAFQSHSNGAKAVRAIFMVARDPSDHHEFLGGFTGQREMRATSLGLEVATPRGKITVLNPDAYRSLLGDAAADDIVGDLPRLAALEIACNELSERQVVPASKNAGLTLVLSPES